MSLIRNILKKIKFFRTKYQPLVKVLVFENRLRKNLQIFSERFPKVKFAPVLKSNAYGHGLLEVAQILQNENVPFFVVDSFFEALLLRSRNIKKSILIIGYTTLEQTESLSKKNTAITIVSLGQLEILSKQLKKKIVCHLKIDTGMHRQGIMPADFIKAKELIHANQNILLEGICSHFADADGVSNEFTNKQIEIWHEAIKFFKNNFSSIKYFHISNSAGVKFSNQIEANIIRLGIGLYGYDQSKEVSGLKPALEMRTIISGIKELNVGDFVGYNNTFQATQKMKIATLPVGYFEGVDRRLSGIGFVKIKDQFCKILGRVSMNIISVDISSAPGIKVNDEVVVISAEETDKNSILNMALDSKTIPYELLVHIPQHLRREVI